MPRFRGSAESQPFAQAGQRAAVSLARRWSPPRLSLNRRGAHRWARSPRIRPAWPSRLQVVFWRGQRRPARHWRQSDRFGGTSGRRGKTRAHFGRSKGPRATRPGGPIWGFGWR